MRIAGRTVWYRVTGQGAMHCESCGGDRPYQRRAGRRWLHLLHVPLVPLDSTGEHLRCTVCRTAYRVELIAVPTIAAMQQALLAGAAAAVRAMLMAGDAASPAARRLAVGMIQAAGAPDYDDVRLAADLAGRPAGPSDGSPARADGGLELALTTLAIQLEIPAREWFLANVVRVGLADGPLTVAERREVAAIARHFGMTSAQAQDVIWLTEEAAPAG